MRVNWVSGATYLFRVPLKLFPVEVLLDLGQLLDDQGTDQLRELLLQGSEVGLGFFRFLFRALLARVFFPAPLGRLLLGRGSSLGGGGGGGGVLGRLALLRLVLFVCAADDIVDRD